MKKIFLVAFYLVIVLTLNAQSAKISEVKQGTTVQVEFYAQGQIYPMVLKVATLSADELVFSYDFMGSVMGKFFNNKANLDKGQRFNWDEPVDGEERKVSDDQTLMVISRTAFKELKENPGTPAETKEAWSEPPPPGIPGKLVLILSFTFLGTASSHFPMYA